MQRARLVAALVAVLMAVGCARTEVRSDVTRFSEIPAIASGQTFVILPLQSQQGSLEFATYADNVTRHLQQNGYRLVTDVHQADYAVSLTYAVGDPKTETGVMPLYGQTGGGYSAQTGTFNGYGGYGNAYGTYSGSTYTAPTYGVVGAVPYSNTTYSRVLLMDIADLHKSTASQAHKSFEGKVISTGSNGNFNVVAGCLIDAMFDGFPGANGASKTVQVELDKCSK